MKEDKVVFLDVDGVLNKLADGSTRIRFECIEALNHIIDATKCVFVLSSSWRYFLFTPQVYGDDGYTKGEAPMTCSGWNVLMRSHGTRGFHLIGTTVSDEHYGLTQRENLRAKQIKRWMRFHGKGVESFVVIDDDDDGISALGLPFVRTDPEHGLTEGDALRAIELLGRRESVG